MSEVNECQGYQIIDRQRVGDVEIVLGNNPKAPQPYVTWKSYAHSNFEEFAYGHYFDTHEQARIDFYDRLKEQWELYAPRKHKAQEQKKSTRKKSR